MKKMVLITMILLTIFICQTGLSQSSDAEYDIGVWHDFRNAAVSFTFDDGSPNQYSKAIPIFNEFDLNLTLFIITGNTYGWPANWSALQNAANDGHEIASHTITHTSFADINDSLETVELQQSRDTINAHITGQKCFTMAYPYCVTGNQSICAEFYDAARICSGSIETSTPRNFMAISSIICGTEGSIKTADNFVSKASSAISKHGWCVYLLHGVDDDGGWSPVPSDVLRETLQRFVDQKNDFWVDSFGNVVRYIKERDLAVITEISVQDSSITVQVTDSLDNEIYNFPLSIRRALPEGWGSAEVTQNDQAVESKIVVVDGALYVQFDAVPDNGNIVILRKAGTSVENQNPINPADFSLSQNYPNPFNPLTTIDYAVPVAEHVFINLYNMRGELVQTLVDRKHAAGTYSVILDVADLPSGLYFYKMMAGSFHQTKRLLLMK